MKVVKTRLHLFRHGECEGEGSLNGHVDRKLTPVGRASMAKVAENLAGMELGKVYSSDLSRSVESARYLAGEGGVTELATFRELDMGHWDGEPMGELWEREPEGMKAWWRDLTNYKLPGGESLAELRNRVLAALAPLVKLHAGGSFTIVAHGGVNRVILFEILKMDLQHYHSIAQDFSCRNIIDFYDDGKSVVRLING